MTDGDGTGYTTMAENGPQTPVQRFSGRKRLKRQASPAEAVLSALSEAEFQRDVIAGLEQRGYAIWHVVDSRLMRAGLPDLIALGPLNRQGVPIRVLFWELKTMTGRVRPEQASTIDYLQMVGAGVDARVVRPADWMALKEMI